MTRINKLPQHCSVDTTNWPVADEVEIVQALGNKYGAVLTWSELCQREFASKLECKRAEELRLMEMAGEIYGLVYQPPFILSIKPKITYTADFCYKDKSGNHLFEDAKGKLTEATRIKIAWVKEKYGIEVKLIGKGY